MYGFADHPSRSLHIVALDPLPDGPMEHLVAHEWTHILAGGHWAHTGTPLLGEGLAVWVSGGYAGRDLHAWKEDLASPPPAVATLLGPEFREMPEADAYPLAGILVGVLVKQEGLEAVREHFLPATRATWERACRDAGTTPGKVEAAFRKALRPRD